MSIVRPRFDKVIEWTRFTAMHVYGSGPKLT